MNTTTQGDGIKIGYNNTGFVRLHGNSIQATWYNPITQTGDGGIIYGGTHVDSGTFGLVIAPWLDSAGGIRLDRYGNVGIKTGNTQGYQLAVNGSAIFTSAYVKPYGNWPDYVFQKTYHLPSLNEVETYIQANHRLPDAPSADSVQKNGVDIGFNERFFKRTRQPPAITK